MKRSLQVGTRGSALARWQTSWARTRIEALGYPTEAVEIRTTGDLAPEVPLQEVADPQFFTRELDQALLDGRIDLAIHSLKDLPTTLADGIAIAAISRRADPCDALVGRNGAAWATLPEGAALATCSLRRRAQLLRARPDLRILEVRGNIDTRLSKLDRNQDWHGLILAAAGLTRLGLAGRIGERLSLEMILPAPGQGALAATVRADDDFSGRILRAAIAHYPTALTTGAERAFLQALGGGCQIPAAAFGTLEDVGENYRLRLRGRVLSPNGDLALDGERIAMVSSLAEACATGQALAGDLIQAGAKKMLEKDP